MARQDVFAKCRSGVAQVCMEKAGDWMTAGSAFLVDGGLVTNSHVLRALDFDVAVIRFEDLKYAAAIRLARDDCVRAIADESPEDEHDVAFLRLNEPEFKGRHVFSLGGSGTMRVGDEVGFLGYPFRMEHLTCSVGFLSSVYQQASVTVLQVDGSVNGGNSGGPLVELETGRVVGVVTRTEVGFLANQFDALLRTLAQNVDTLRRGTGVRALIGGVDPIQGLAASQQAMLQIATDLRRSANVGIGYAFGVDYVRDRIAQLNDRHT